MIIKSKLCSFTAQRKVLFSLNLQDMETFSEIVTRNFRYASSVFFHSNVVFEPTVATGTQDKFTSTKTFYFHILSVFMLRSLPTYEYQ